MPENEPTIAHVLCARAALHPDATAITYETSIRAEPETTSYEQLVRDASALAARIRDQGPTVNGQVAVLIALPNGLDYVRAYFGAALAGAVAVTAFPPAPTVRLAHGLDRLVQIIADCDPTVVIAERDVLDRLQAHLATVGSERSGRAWLAPEDCRAAPVGPVVVDACDSHLGLLQYTSGSTATPKGVMVPHANLMVNIAALRRRAHVEDRDPIVGWLPLFHDMGLIGLVLLGVHAGSSTHLLAPNLFVQRPWLWLQRASEHRAVATFAPNFGYQLVARRTTDEQRAAMDLRHLRAAVCGGEAVRSSAIDAFTSRFAPAGFAPEAFLPGYGLAEATLAVSVGGPRGAGGARRIDRALLRAGRAVSSTDPDAAEVVACGTAVDDTSVRIVDPETCRPVDDGTIGEIWVGGAAVAIGYWQRPEDTEQTFDARLHGSTERFLRTGDLGFAVDGLVYITGRMREVLIWHGENHFPADIESTVESSEPRVRPSSTAAFAVTDGDADERIVLVTEVPGDTGADEAESIVTSIRRIVADVHGIQLSELRLVTEREVPKTTSGKIQRSESRQRHLDGHFQSVAHWVRDPAPAQ